MAEIYRDIVAGKYHRIGDRDSEVFIASNAGVPASGTSGFGAGTMAKGSLVIDTTGGFLYENRGTKASPTWDAIGAIGEAEIADGAITTGKIGADAVDGTKIADNAVDTEHITDGAVTEAKLNASVAGEGLEGGAGDPLKVVVSEGTIVEPVAALRVLGTGNAEITFTADVAGIAAHDYSIEIVNGGISQPLSITDSGGAIQINAATDGAGVITTSANDAVTAFNAHATTYSIPITASVESGTGADPIVVAVPSNLANGVDGTVGYKGQALFDASFIYVSVGVSTVAVGSWKKATLAAI